MNTLICRTFTRTYIMPHAPLSWAVHVLAVLHHGSRNEKWSRWFAVWRVPKVSPCEHPALAWSRTYQGILEEFFRSVVRFYRRSLAPLHWLHPSAPYFWPFSWWFRHLWWAKRMIQLTSPSTTLADTKLVCWTNPNPSRSTAYILQPYLDTIMKSSNDDWE